MGQQLIYGKYSNGKSLPISVDVDGNVVVDPVNRGAMTDRSGTITTGGTAQQAAASSATRKGLMVQNLSDTTDLWCRTDGTAAAAAGSFRAQPGQMLTFDAAMVGTGAVSVFSTLTGHGYTIKEL